MRTNKSTSGNAGGLLLIAICSLFLIWLFAGCEQAPGPLSRQEETPTGETPSGGTHTEETPTGETSSEETPTEPGSDAALKSLELSEGTLEPAFSPATTAYTAAVSSDVTSITVTGVPRSSAAAAGGDNGTPKALEVGENPPIRIVVTAEDGVTARTYTVTVTRSASGFISVNTAEDMAKIGIDPAWPLEGSYKLAADITLENWAPIGPDSAFSGSFDGDGKKITVKSFDEGFVYTNNSLGVFAAIQGSEDAKALVRNLTVHAELDYSHLSNKRNYSIGILTGQALQYSVCEDITVTGTLAFSSGRLVSAGGVAGSVNGGEITGCANNASITVSGMGAGGSYTYVTGL